MESGSREMWGQTSFGPLSELSDDLRHTSLRTFHQRAQMKERVRVLVTLVDRWLLCFTGGCAFKGA